MELRVRKLALLVESTLSRGGFTLFRKRAILHPASLQTQNSRKSLVCPALIKDPAFLPCGSGCIVP